jgi:SAM-dependent methyltransferase
MGVNAGTMQNAVNWNDSWVTMLSVAKRLEACNASYWDKQAQTYDENTAYMTDLTTKQLTSMQLNPLYTVLDIGAGSGRLTIPMAKQVKHVTAIEPSTGMLNILNKKAQTEHLTNISTLNQPWEAVNIYSDITPHDVVVSSLSFFMLDLEMQLKKMASAAKKYVYLFMSASKWLDDELQKIVEFPVPLLPDYIYISNILKDLGICANVEFFDCESTQKFATFQEALTKFTTLYHIPQTQEPQLRQYLSKRLQERDGQFWLNRNKKVAMLWWTKPQ